MLDMQGRNSAVPPSLKDYLSFHLNYAERGTAVNSKPVIQIMRFYRFAPTTGSLLKKSQFLLRILHCLNIHMYY